MKKVWGIVDFDSIYQYYGVECVRVVVVLEYLYEYNYIEFVLCLIIDVYCVDYEKL